MALYAFIIIQLNTGVDIHAQNLSTDWKDNVKAGFESMYSKEDLKEFMDEVDKLADLRDKQKNQVVSQNAETENDSDENEEYSDFAIADVDNYVNVRTAPNTDSEIVGRMYDGAVAQIQEEVEGEDGTWLMVISGNLTGYIKAEYFIYGQDAVDVIDDYVDRYAIVRADRLNIRQEADIESKRIGYALIAEL